VALKRFFAKLTTPMNELDSQKLREFCGGITDVTAISDLEARAEVAVVGEISSLRIVPRAGSPWLEATISDGTGSIVALWTGRRRIAGIDPGRRLVLRGRAAPTASDRRLTIYNPAYELL
jgi:hypothetical protein